MRKKISTFILLGFAFGVAITLNVFLRYLPRIGSKAPAVADVAFLNKMKRVDFTLLLRLKIPRINIDAYVENVSLLPDGAMDVPKDPVNVGWFDLGPRPGGNGSAVLAGHYGWRNGRPAVFDDLHKLQKGDKVYVEDEKGGNLVFIVREVRIYDRNGDASSVFISNDGRAHLNLITCAGAWNRNEKTHSERLVVFTDREPLYSF